jgi:hypothetical protein
MKKVLVFFIGIRRYERGKVTSEAYYVTYKMGGMKCMIS